MKTEQEIRDRMQRAERRADELCTEAGCRYKEPDVSAQLANDASRHATIAAILRWVLELK